MFPPFQKYLNPQVRNRKLVNSVVYCLFPSRLGSMIHPFIFFRPLRVLSLTRMLVKFSLTYILHHLWEKNFQFMVITFLENALNLCIFTHAPVPNSKFQVEVLEICFPKTNGVQETMICFIKIQSENMTMTWNICLFIFSMICHFSKCDGVTVLWILSIK